MAHLGVPNPPLPNRKRPNNGIAFTQSGKSDYRSSCSICRLGIFTGDPTVWGRGLHTGLLHEPCAVRAGVTVVAQQPTAPAAPQAAAKPAAVPAELPRAGGVLTPRQAAVVARLAEGHTLAQVAAIDHISLGSVKNALHRARTRLGVADNAALIEAARKYGLIRTTKGS